MALVISDMSISLDGYVTGPNDSRENPFGDGAEMLHDWMFDAATDDDRAILQAARDGVGAIVMGRRSFDKNEGDGGWGDAGPVGDTPCFVVTHNMPAASHSPVFTFVTDGVVSAIEQAQNAAGDKDVTLHGATIMQQALPLGLVDEIRVHVIPVLLGGGTPLFGTLDASITLERTQARVTRRRPTSSSAWSGKPCASPALRRRSPARPGRRLSTAAPPRDGSARRSARHPGHRVDHGLPAHRQRDRRRAAAGRVDWRAALDDRPRPRAPQRVARTSPSWAPALAAPATSQSPNLDPGCGEGYERAVLEPYDEEQPMTIPTAVMSEREWNSQREALLGREKQLTRARDPLAAERRRLPMVRVQKKYRFEGPEGEVGLLEPFERRRQLIVYRFFLDPGMKIAGYPKQGCPGCTVFADNLPNLTHLNPRDTTQVFVSADSQDAIRTYRARMGGADWPWHTTRDDFSADFDVSERFGINVFLRDGDQIYRSHYTTARAAGELSSVWALLDITPFGRQEEFRDTPEGVPQDRSGSWTRRHDEYTPQELAGGRS